MNQYPVLFVSFKDVEAEVFEDAYEMLGACLSDMCKGLSEVIDTESVDQDDRDAFRRLKSESGKKSDIKNSLKMITRMMYAVYGKKTILLIDEYDVPLAKASEKDNTENQYYSRMLDVIKGIMSASLKDNEFLNFAVVTGCLRIAKESIFTGANNFLSYSVLDADFSEYFGFSADEVDTILKAARALKLILSLTVTIMLAGNIRIFFPKIYNHGMPLTGYYSYDARGWNNVFL